MGRGVARAAEAAEEDDDPLFLGLGPSEEDEVEPGEVFAILGPNGAGKSTTVEILEGHRRRDSGRVSVLGVDPTEGGRTFRNLIGIVLQEAGVDKELTVRETLDLYSTAYTRRRSIDEVIENVRDDAAWVACRRVCPPVHEAGRFLIGHALAANAVNYAYAANRRALGRSLERFRGGAGAKGRAAADDTHVLLMPFALGSPSPCSSSSDAASGLCCIIL